MQTCLVLGEDAGRFFPLPVDGHGRREAELGLLFRSGILLLLRAHGLPGADDCGNGGDGQ